MIKFSEQWNSYVRGLFGWIDQIKYRMWIYEEILSLSGCDFIRDLRSMNHFIDWYIFFHKLAVKQGNDINFTDEQTPKFLKLMSVGSGLVLTDSLTLYHIWSYAQQTKRTHRNMPNAPLMKVCPKQCSLFVIKSKIRETYSQQTLIQILSNDQNKWIPKMICDNNTCTFYAVSGTIWCKCLNAVCRISISLSL